MSHVSESQGPNYPTSVTQITPGVVWANHLNAANAPDGVVSTVSLLSGEVGRFMRGVPAGLGFTVPPGATITGIELVARCKAGTGA